MLIEEFEKRTGRFPTIMEYKIIERHYMDFSSDKDIFVKRINRIRTDWPKKFSMRQMCS